MRKENSKFITKCISEAGSFKKNRDFTGFINLDDYACWVLVDGIDSSDEKNSAEIVATSIIEDFTLKPGFSKSLLKKYLKNANKILLDYTGKTNLAASVAVVISDYSNVIFGTAGNVRLYHLRKDKLIRRTKDHSITRLLYELGEINKDSEDTHKHKGLLHNFLGKEGRMYADVSSKISLYNDDVILAGTQGMWENLDEKELGDILKGSMDTEEFAENLEYIVKDNGNANLNNYSIMSLFVQDTFDKKLQKKKQNEKKPKKKIDFSFLKNKIVKKIAMVILIVIIVAIGLYVKKNMDLKKSQTQQKEAVEEKVSEGDKLLISGNLKDSLANFEEAKEKYKDNPEKLKEIDEKIVKIKAVMSIQELEVLGDKNFESKDYEGAANKYTEALNIANTQKTDGIATLTDKLNKAKENVKFLALEKSGDDNLLKQNYEEAKNIYDNIIATAEPNKFVEIVTRVKEKIGSINKIEDAADIEKQALELYKKGKYQQSKQKFEQALSIYSETGIEQKKKDIRVQISEIEELQAYEDTIQEGKFLEEAGDNELEKKSYDKAEGKYNDALKKYQIANSQKDLISINNKLNSIEELKKIDVAKNVENEGDSLFSTKKYKKAIEKYEEAKSKYLALNKIDDANAMDEKIKICKKKDKILGIF